MGRFGERKAAKKAAGGEGVVVFHCAPRCFLSAAPYLMGRATLGLLRELPGLEEMTI